jgi:hypothetical protein
MKQSWGVVALAVLSCVVPVGCGESTSSPRGGSAAGGGGGEGGVAEAGNDGDGQEPTAAASGQPHGGDTGVMSSGGGEPSSAGAAGLAHGGEAASGGAAGATNVAGASTTDGGAGSGGDGGDGGDGGGAGGDGTVVTPGCRFSSDCDDGIPCTVDRCASNHICSHYADNSLCQADTGECLGCDPSAGCVSRAMTTTEVLLDKDFDQLSGVWSEASATYFYALFESQYADTLPYLAEFGPADLDADEQEHATLSQTFVLPAGTQKLTFRGSYQLSPGGTQLDIEDSTRVALHLGASANEAYLFNVWLGVEPAVHFWKSFRYEAGRADLTSLLGKSTRLELEANTWDTIFDFDSLSLEATVCPP